MPEFTEADPCLPLGLLESPSYFIALLTFLSIFLSLPRSLPIAALPSYVGQVNVIKKGEAACYECEEKATQKIYPICTIRSTPDKPVHCVVWAKEAYKLVFGQQDASLLFEAPDAPEPSLYMPLVLARPPQGAGQEAAVRYGVRVLEALFHHELEAKVAQGLYKSKQVQPAPVACLGGEGAKTEDEWVETVLGSHGKHGDDSVDSNSTSSSIPLDNREETRKNGNPTGNGEADWTRQVWGPEACVLELLRVFAALYGNPARREHVGAYEFDKDDLLAMRFVAAATNLRAASFGIRAQSFHDTKGIAGNIVPAIATTNAMAAGLQVLEALKILRAALLPPSLPPSTIVDAACKVNYIVRAYAGRKRLLLQPTALHPPNPACFVCNRSRIDLILDTQTTTLAFLVNEILKAKLSFAHPSVMIGGNILYEEGEDADEDLAALNLAKPLCTLPAGGIKHETIIEIDDMSQELTLQVNVYHQDWAKWEGEPPPEGFLLGGGAKEAMAAAAAAAGLQKEMREKAQGLYAKEEEAKESLRVGRRGGIKKKRESEEEMATRGALEAEEEETEGHLGGQAKRLRLTVGGKDDKVVVVDDEHPWTEKGGGEGGGHQTEVICLD